MSDDDMRPLRQWPEWLLVMVVASRKGDRARTALWCEAYFELVERSYDAMQEYVECNDCAWPVDSPTWIQ